MAGKVQNALAFPTANRTRCLAPVQWPNVAQAGGTAGAGGIMSTLLSGSSKQSEWIEQGWDDDQDAERPPLLGVALLAALAMLTAGAVVLAVWLLATGQVG
jgi:hypothetical protein